MLLQTDEQTISDLELFGRKTGSGIYDIFNSLHTRGGERLMVQMFYHPLSDKEAINLRSGIIRGFAIKNIRFPYDVAAFDAAEKYLASNENRGEHKGRETDLNEKDIQSGVAAVIGIIATTNVFVQQPALGSIAEYAQEQQTIIELLTDPVLIPVLKELAGAKLAYSAVTAFDALFRQTAKEKIKKLLGLIYSLDVYLSVAQIAVERKFVFPKALDKKLCLLRAEQLYHPALKNAVANDVFMNETGNVIFLTGANMAGKSTFLRTISIALYLAHMGFPVPARSMEFSVLDGIYTTINLPDNLGIGASHFYMEVLRVKKMAKELSTGRSFFILFDELFRGTNVKDAFEATVAVTKGFAKKKTSMFVISSHIVEAGEQLKDCRNIDFLFLPTRMNGHVPEYTYRLETGITNDRHGMIIIRNEGILDILNKGKKDLRINHHKLTDNGISYR